MSIILIAPGLTWLNTLDATHMPYAKTKLVEQLSQQHFTKTKLQQGFCTIKMRLYATITSERATKGQGGNQYLIIELLIGSKDNPVKIGTLDLNYDKYLKGYNLNLRISPYYTDDNGGRSIFFSEDKINGKRQKDELCNCGMNAGFHIKQNNCK